MKQLFLPAFAFLLLTSCGGNDTKVKSVQENEDGTTTTTTYDVDNAKKMAEASDDMEKKMEELKKLTPMNLDQLKAQLPEEVMGIKRTNFNASTAMGYAFAEGEYQKDDTTDIKVAIYDCAGEAGAGWYGLNYWTKMSFQQESATGYTKTIDFKGDKAVETYDSNSRQSTLTYVVNDRLLVMLTGRNISPEALRQAAQNLSFKV